MEVLAEAFRGGLKDSCIIRFKHNIYIGSYFYLVAISGVPLMKGSITIKRTKLMNAIQDNRLIFLSNVNKESKRFVWGRQTAFQDVLEGWECLYDHDTFMQKLSSIPGASSQYWVRDGLNFILGIEGI